MDKADACINPFLSFHRRQDRIISSVIRKNSFMNSWKPTDYGKVSPLNSCYNLFLQTFSLSPTSRWKLNTEVSIWFVPVFVTPFELWAVSNDINESKNKYFALFFCHLILTLIAQGMFMKLQTLVICLVGQLFVTDTSFFNVFLICLKNAIRYWKVIDRLGCCNQATDMVVFNWLVNCFWCGSFSIHSQ